MSNILIIIDKKKKKEYFKANTLVSKMYLFFKPWENAKDAT